MLESVGDGLDERDGGVGEELKLLVYVVGGFTFEGTFDVHVCEDDGGIRSEH